MVVANDVIVRMGEIKVRPARQDPGFPVTLRVDISGKLRGGDLEVRYPRGIR